MQINRKSNQSVEIKSKDVTITLNGDVTVNQFNISGPGEYEISGVEAFGIKKGLYYFRAEDINLAFIGPELEEMTSEEQKELSDVSVLIVSIENKKMDLKKIGTIIKAIEPTVIIPTGKDDIKEFCSLVGGCQEPAANFKITKAQLAVMEGQSVVVLNAQ